MVRSPASCDEVARELHESPADLSPPNQEHLLGCPACQAVQRELLAMATALRAQVPPPLPAGFELELRRRLQSEVRARPRSSGLLWTGAAAAAAAALLLTFGLLLMRSAPPPAGDPGTRSYHRLHLSVRVLQAGGEASFDVKLPPGVRLAPEAGTALGSTGWLRWRSQLQVGHNDFDLPLVAERLPAQVAVRISSGSSEVRGQVQLEPRQGKREGERPALQLALRLEAPAGRARP